MKNINFTKKYNHTATFQNTTNQGDSDKVFFYIKLVYYNGFQNPTWHEN